MTATYEGTAADIIARYEAAELAYRGAVDGVKDALLIENGFSVETDATGVLTDLEALKPRTLEVLSRRIVRNPDDRAKIGLSKYDLFDEVVPDHPDYDKANKIELKAMAELRRYIDGATQLGPTGYVQSRLPDGLVLQKAKVHRGNDPVVVTYVTDDIDLILTGSLQPDIDHQVHEAARLSAKATMIVLRQPAIAAAARRAISAGMKKATLAAAPAVPDKDGVGG